MKASDLSKLGQKLNQNFEEALAKAKIKSYLPTKKQNQKAFAKYGAKSNIETIADTDSTLPVRAKQAKNSK